jgi:murein DD-endopeptidase MepM/ murein hydrolase activator NlpD
VDLASPLAGPGTVVVAPAAGVVTFEGVVAGRPVISIDHGRGLVSSLEPVSAAVQRGHRLRAGEVLGVVSDRPGHCGSRTCVHWGVRSGGRYINPLSLVPGAFGPIILLPDSPS